MSVMSSRIDLFVIGAKGYFGVNGTFVSELDLSQIPAPDRSLA